MSIRNKHCTECELSQFARHVCMMGAGNKNAKVVLIGEAPGAQEDIEGEPFVGASGELLEDALEKLGYSRDDVYMTNAVRCRPEGNATPTVGQIKACNDYLVRELDVIKPKLIVPLGNSALRAVTKKSGITKYCGKSLMYHSDGWDANVVPTFHPSAVLRSPKNLEPFFFGLSRAFELYEGNVITEKINYHILDTLPKIKSFIRTARKYKEVAFDVETDSLYWWKDDVHICTIGFSFRKGVGYVVPLHHRQSPFTDKQQNYILRLLGKYIFSDSTIIKTAHNIKFDMSWMRSVGLEVKGKIHDTMLMHHLLDENARHDLDTLSLIHTQYGEYWKYVKEHGIDKGKAYDIDLKELAEYNAKDCDVALRLRKKFTVQLRDVGKLYRVYKYIVVPAIRSFAEIEYNGMLINQKYLRKLDRRFQKEIEKIARELGEFKQCVRYVQNVRDCVPINFNSPIQVKDLLFDNEHGFNFPVRKDWISYKTKKVTTGERVLTELMETKRGRPFATKLLEYRKITKLYGTYVKGMWAHIDKRGYIHPNFKLHGTVTGRPSCSDPNLQNIPRKDIGDYDHWLKEYIKKMFVAPKGYYILELDYSQMELRVFTHFSGEEEMARCFREGIDIHTYTAAEMLGILMEDVQTNDRNVAKRVNFGIIFMIAALGLSIQLTNRKKGIIYNEKQSQKFLDVYYDRFPRVPQQINEFKQLAEEQGYVETLFGRRRRLPDVQSEVFGVHEEALRQAVNSPIQGTAVDYSLLLLNIVLGHLGKRNYLYDGVKVVNMVHDSIMLYVPKKLIKRQAQVVTKKGTSLPTQKLFGFELSVPLVMDANYGNNWKDLKGIKITT